MKSNNLCITLADYNTFTKDILDAKIKEEQLINESVFSERIKTLAAKEDIKALTSKGELKAGKDKIAKTQAFD